jgi:hypothetical protein
MLFSPRFEVAGQSKIRPGIHLSQNGANSTDFTPVLQGKRFDLKAF